MPARPQALTVRPTPAAPAGNKQSLDVNYFHLSSYAPTLAIWLADYPRQMLEIFHQVAHEVVTRHFEDYDLVHEDIFVRITHLPVKCAPPPLPAPAIRRAPTGW